jgi:hypothetical protein
LDELGLFIGEKPIITKEKTIRLSAVCQTMFSEAQLFPFNLLLFLGFKSLKIAKLLEIAYSSPFFSIFKILKNTWGTHHIHIFGSFYISR